jgi:transposase InsO family protein
VRCNSIKSIDGQKYYLFAIMHLFNNEIISYNVSNRNGNKLVYKALKILNKQGNKTIIHVNQGAKFTSKMYTKFLNNKDGISMSRVGNCYNNSCIESLFGHFKDNFYKFHNQSNVDERKLNVNNYIYHYNHERI